MSVTLMFGFVLPLLMLTNCFFSSPERKRISGAYCLERGPSGSHTVVGCSFGAKLRGRTDNGPMNGNVERIGCDDHRIVAARTSVFGGTVGWMILDTRAETLEGPFSDDEFKARLTMNPELAAIRLRSPAKAWEMLQ